MSNPKVALTYAVCERFVNSEPDMDLYVLYLSSLVVQLQKDNEARDDMAYIFNFGHQPGSVRTQYHRMSFPGDQQYNWFKNGVMYYHHKLTTISKNRHFFKMTDSFGHYGVYILKTHL